MCKEKKLYFFVLFAGLLFARAAGALQAEEQWYLISETELRIIEEYKAKSEQEKQNWLSQAQALSMRAARLETESANLNQQLAGQRKKNQTLEQSYNELEAAAFQTISQKNIQIQTLEMKDEKQAWQIRTFWAIVITAGTIFLLFIVFKVLRFFKALPF